MIEFDEDLQEIYEKTLRLHYDSGKESLGNVHLVTKSVTFNC